MLIYFHPSFTIYNLHYEKFQDGTVKCIEDEIPFEVPEGWEWCRGNICFKGMESQKPSGIYFEYIDIESINNKLHIVSTPKYLKVQDAPSRASRKLENGSVLFSLVRPYLENIAYISEKHSNCIASTGFYVCNSSGVLFPEFMFMLMTSKYVVNGLNQFMKGDNSPSIRKEDVENWLYPIPPFSAQKLIVEKVNSILKIVTDIQENKYNLSKHIVDAKSRILDLAIRGKLVPQDSKNEPASVLLERIRAEKEELIKQGKIKNDKKESFIFRGDDNSYYETINENTVCIDDELPFELPEGWTWTRLQNISSILTDGTHKTPQYCDNGYVFLSSKNVTTGKIDWENIMYIPESLHEELYNRLSPTKGDILLAKNGTTGVAAIVDRDIIFDIYVSLALIRIAGGFIDSQYILNVISSSWVQEYFNKSLKGIGVPNLHLEHIRRTLIPISPYAEQQKIIRITNKVFQILNEISRILS